MPGGTQTYECRDCPLLLELGGGVVWDDSFAVTERFAQVACAVCGTLHRLTEGATGCRVEAQPGPIRARRVVPGVGFDGEPVELSVDTPEEDWAAAGDHPGGLAADLLVCARCGAAAPPVTLERVHPAHNAGRTGDCPVCAEPLECVGVASWS